MNYENLKYSITEYYDQLINKLDIYIETEIENEIRSNKTKIVKLQYLNKLRDDFINEIELTKNENLKECELNSISIQTILDGIERKESSDGQNCENLIEKLKKEVIFKKFCFLIFNKQRNLVYLLSCHTYFNSNEIKYFE